MLFYAVERREVASRLDAPLAHECFFIDEQGRCVTFLCTSGAGVSPVHAPAGQGCCLFMRQQCRGGTLFCTSRGQVLPCYAPARQTLHEASSTVICWRFSYETRNQKVQLRSKFNFLVCFQLPCWDETTNQKVQVLAKEEKTCYF